MDPFDKHPAAPNALADRERHFTDLALAVVDTDALTHSAFDPAIASWEGIATAELRAAPQPARNQAYRVASELTWAATATRAWADHVQRFNTKVDGLRDERAGIPFEVERFLASTRWTSWPILDQDAIRARKRDELIHDLHRRWGEAFEEHIEGGSREVAGLFERGPTWENLARARRLRALPAASPLLRFFVAGWEATAGPEEALRLAGLFRDPDRRPTSADIEQLHSMLGRFAEDESFWFEFLTGLGPDGLLTLSGGIALHLPATPPGLAVTDPGLARMLGHLQAMLGTGLALASSRRTAPNAYRQTPPGQHELPAEWLIALTGAGRRRYQIVTWRAGDSLPVALLGYQLLGPLLNTGRYDDRFLQLVGGDLVDFEMAHTGARLWSDWLTELGAYTMSMRLDWTGGPDPAQPNGFDPITGLVTAMDRNPEGALDLLAGRIESGHRMPRLDHLLTDRDWPWAWVTYHQNREYLEHHPGAHHPSPGVARLGEALARVARLDDPRAVTLVTQIVSELSIDEQAMGYHDGAVPGDRWSRAASNLENDIISPVLRGSMANILADYIIDVNAAVRDSGAAMPGGLGAEFDPTHLIRLLADLGKDESAHDTLVGAQTAYAAAAYHHYLSGEANLRNDSLQERIIAAEGVARSYGAVAGALDVGAATADWYAQWQQDLARNTRVADRYALAEIAIGSAADLASAKAPGVSYAAGELTRDVLGELRETLIVDHAGWSTYRNAELFGDSRQAVVALAEAALYHSGQLAGLDGFALLEPDGQLKGMSEWNDDDRDAWLEYKKTAGSATASALLDQAGSAYQDGIDRAGRIFHGTIPTREGTPTR